MPRLVGLGLRLEALPRAARAARASTSFSRNGDEIAFGTIGNASLRRGACSGSRSTPSACCRRRCCSRSGTTATASRCPTSSRSPRATSREMLDGFRREPRRARGLRPLHACAGWDYPALCETYLARGGDRAPRARAGDRPRRRADPAAGPLDLGQPRALQVEGAPGRGRRSTTACASMRDWMIDAGHRRRRPSSTRSRREDRRGGARRAARAPGRRSARRSSRSSSGARRCSSELGRERRRRRRRSTPRRRARAHASRSAAPRPRRPPRTRRSIATARRALCRRARACVDWTREHDRDNRRRATARDLYSGSAAARRSRVDAGRGRATAPTRRSSTASRCSTPASTRALARDSALIAFGEDVGQLGDVNQGFARPAGEVRRAARHRHRHPREHHHRPGDRPGDARPAADRRDPVSRLHALRPADRSPTTSRRCAGAPRAARRRRSSCARAATGSRASGTPARRWRGILNLVRGI